MTAPMHVTLDIDLDSLLGPKGPFGPDGENGGEQQTLAEVIAEMAAARMLASLGHEQRVDIQHRARQITDDEIRAQVQPLIATALERSMRKTNPWGEPTGEPATLAETIVAEAQRQLTKPTQGDSYDSTRRKTLVQDIIAKEVERTIRYELADEMSKVKEQVAAAIREQGAAVLTETIRRMSGVG
jgi:hypothetical protein